MKEEFVRRMRSLVGDHMVKMALFKLQQEEVKKTLFSSVIMCPLPIFLPFRGLYSYI